jgi:putative oxidoreductase
VRSVAQGPGTTFRTAEKQLAPQRNSDTLRRATFAKSAEERFVPLNGSSVMPDYVQAIGRLLLSIVFIVFGFIQFTHIDNYITNPAVVKIAAMTGGVVAPTVLAYLVAAINLFGGILILVGYQTRWAAIVLIAFVALTLFFAHNFWTMDGAARAANQADFYKNLAIIGGLLFLISVGPGRCSLEHRLSKS